MSGFFLRIFVPSGDPEGLRIIEKSGWTGVGPVFPRAAYSETRRRRELDAPGVYVLWGDHPAAPLSLAYVGHADALRNRLDEHARSKEFWTHAAAFTSKDCNLNKAHANYLEARLVALAKEARRCRLENANIPQGPALSEADRADAEAFLADMLLCLPLVGVRFFERPRAPAGQVEFVLRGKGVEAWAYETPEGFVVRAGSRASKKEAPSFRRHVQNSAARRDGLIEVGVLVDDGDTYRFAQDYTFTSPSAASDVILGCASSGPLVWKDTRGRTLRQVREEALGDS